LHVLATVALLSVGIIACRDAPTEPAPDPLDLEFATVTAGVRHTCALTTAGVAYCWGRNVDGELGGGESPAAAIVRVSGGLKFTSLDAGSAHNCGIVAGGATYCWGLNEDGQLGDGTRTPSRSTPVRVTGRTFTSVSGGVYHTCGLEASGAAYCWGNNEFGMLGDGTVTDRLSPTLVTGGFTWASIEASHFHTCGLTTGGVVYCWGADDGRLGDGTVENVVRPTPSRVSGDMVLASIGTTHGAHLCGLVAGGSARCWGFNDYGQLGDGTRTARLGAVTVTGGLAFQTVDGGGEAYSCGLTSAGAASCWGLNQLGQLGDGTLGLRLTPTPVSGGLTFKSLALGAGQTCGVTNDGEIWCWGQNDFGELGNSAAANPSMTPVRVGG
jgi:alpha-tubulin suppressor-like RCC1 family protein